MKKTRLSLILLVILILSFTGSALAQTYSFSMDQQTVHYYLNEDGTASVDYVFVFTNDSFASPIDYVDVGLPNNDFDEGEITADVNGQPVYDISASGYQGDGTGVAIGLGPLAIQPGATGSVHVFIPRIQGVLYPDTRDANYTSSVFAPTWFGSQYVHGTTDLSMTFHLPPGVKPEEPRWHDAPNGFPAEPERYLDEQGRVAYTWRNPQAPPDRQLRFGASFPRQYVPASAIASTSISGEDVAAFLFCCGIGAFIIAMIFLAFYSARKRKLQYLPPKIAIEGHGIKRGLTAVEAGILLEESLDKVMTMILFGVIKKNAATVLTRDPLELEIVNPYPEGLYPYEVAFLDAFKEKAGLARKRKLQTMTVDLIKSVANKMKGFSRRETIAYYREITNRAWQQVEAADTPEVKGQKYEEVMEWTMLDKRYGDRTQEVFRGGPVYAPVWWPRYDPVYRTGGMGGLGGGGVSTSSSGPSTGSTSPGGTIPLPNLPGSAFAASVVGGVQNFASSVIGNVTEFTGNVTNKTNPPPPPPPSSGGGRGSGGGGCACACACAGCACACAGGGR